MFYRIKCIKYLVFFQMPTKIFTVMFLVIFRQRKRWFFTFTLNPKKVEFCFALNRLGV